MFKFQWEMVHCSSLSMGLKIHQEWSDFGIVLGLLQNFGTWMFAMDELLINVSVGLFLCCCKSRSQRSSFRCHCSLSYHSLLSFSSRQHFSLLNSLCSLSTSLCSLLAVCLCSFICLMIERAVASRWLSCESVMSVSESEASSVASFFVAHRRDIAVLALFWCWYGFCAVCDVNSIGWVCVFPSLSCSEGGNFYGRIRSLTVRVWIGWIEIATSWTGWLEGSQYCSVELIGFTV